MPVDITGLYDHRLYDVEDPRHMLQFMCGQGLSNMSSNAEGLTADAREKIETLANHARFA